MTALVWCPFPDEDAVRLVADAVLSEGLVACVNIVPAMHSMFVWNGERSEASEVGALFKTSSNQLESAMLRIESLHPYDAPAILGWHCDAANEPTRNWLGGLDAKENDNG